MARVAAVRCRRAILFPGQGSQVVGMGAASAAAAPAAQRLFDRASEVLGYDLLRLCTDGPAARLDAHSPAHRATAP